MKLPALIFGACCCSFALGLAVSYQAHRHSLLPLQGWDCVWVTGPEDNPYSELQRCRQ